MGIDEGWQIFPTACLCVALVFHKKFMQTTIANDSLESMSLHLVAIRTSFLAWSIQGQDNFLNQPFHYIIQLPFRVVMWLHMIRKYHFDVEETKQQIFANKPDS